MDEIDLYELEALVKLLDKLDEEHRLRLLKWLNDRYGFRKTGIILNPRNKTTTSNKIPYDNFCLLLNNINIDTEGDKVLAGIYWLSINMGRNKIDAREVNRLLAQCGQRVANITSAFYELINKKLVIQLDKKGQNKQAKKLYGITDQGIVTVENSLRANLT